MIWYVLGEKRYRNQNYTSRVVSKMLSYGCIEFQLQSIYAWKVEINKPSIRVLEKNHFDLVGERRQCHINDGRYYDRLLFDLLAEEYADN